MMYNKMTNAEIRARLDELSEILENTLGTDEKWDKAYREYFNLNAILDERYREENQDAFNAFYEKNIKGKKFEEIPAETLDFYSDWHKDMYGYRPRHFG